MEIESSSEPLEIVGTLMGWVFRDPARDFAVAQFARTDQVHLTICGSLKSLEVGQTLKLFGEWRQHSRYGEQFYVLYAVEDMPVTTEALRAYLGSGKINGVGPALAQRIVDCFGDQTITVLEQSIDRLQEVSGIGNSKLNKIKQAWEKERQQHRALITLQSQGLSKSQSIKVLKRYGREALDAVRYYPYSLLQDIEGMGFKGVDAIALQQGIASDHPMRIHAGVIHVLQNAAQRGHCLLPESSLITEAQTLLVQEDGQLSAEYLQHQIKMMVAAGYLKQEQSRQYPGRWGYYLPYLHEREGLIAAALRRLHSVSSPPLSLEFFKWFRQYCQQHDLLLSDAQKQAVMIAVSHNVTIITGGPGTGKTLVTRVILAWWREQEYHTVLAAPTGRAAQRLSDVTDHDASTLHRILEYDSISNRFQRDESNPIDAAAIIVDEFSMTDLGLAAALFRSVPLGSPLLIVGDQDQLASIGPGAVLRDFIVSNQIPVVRLTEVYRQAKASAIIQHAYRINQGHTPAIERWSDRPHSDCLWIEAPSPSEGVERICWLLSHSAFPKSQDVQVITPTVKHISGTKSLNPILQDLVNPAHPEKPVIDSPERQFRLGDRVVQRKNNYSRSVFNGEQGYIVDVDVKKVEIIVAFNAQPATYSRGDFNELDLAYAITGHKAQGCEFPVIVVPLFMQSAAIINRQWLYTALTRARQFVVFVGQTRALRYAILQPQTKPRFTLLADRIIEAFADESGNPFSAPFIYPF